MSLSAVAASTEPDGEADPSRAPAETEPGGRVFPLLVVAAVVTGVLLRTWTASPMWLDEALTANIAALGLDDLHGALKQDGAPPLYYALLALWSSVAGTSDAALRLLSAVFSVTTLFLIHRLGTRRGGPAVAAAAVVLMATSPFAIRYATEARMYSLIALLVAAGWLAVMNALERPRLVWLIATGGCAGLLLLTHYWSFYVVGATGGALLLVAWRDRVRRPAALRVAAAIAIGSAVLFGPWVPTFLFHLQHTGTPWGTPPGPVEVTFTTLVDFGGGPYPEGQALAAVLCGLALLALFGKAVDGRRIELDLRTRPGVRADFAVAAVALLTGVAVGFVAGSAWASRYTSIAFPLVVLVAAYGVRSFADRRVAAAVLAVSALLGSAGGVRNAMTDRTQAGEAAKVIAAAGGGAGDVVVYCPDQIGPDVHRVLPDGMQHLTFPDLADPRLIDWVDYERRMRAADPAAFASEVLARAEGRSIFYVWMPGYRTHGKQCERVNDAFGNARPGNRQLMDPDDDYFERQAVWFHPATRST